MKNEMAKRFFYPTLVLMLGLCTAFGAHAERTPYSDALRAAEHLAAKRGDTRFGARLSSLSLPSIPGVADIHVKEFVFQKPLTEYEASWYAGLFDLTIVEIELRKALPLTGQIQTGRVYKLYEKDAQMFKALNESTAAFYGKYSERQFIELLENPDLQSEAADSLSNETTGDIYTVRFAGSIRALTNAARVLPADVFDVTVRGFELERIQSAVFASMADAVSVSMADVPLHLCPELYATPPQINHLGRPEESSESTLGLCDDPFGPPIPPPPPPPPPPQTVAEYDFDSKFSSEVQAPGNLPGPAGTVSSVGRILLCGIDPATGNSYQIQTTYGRTELEGNCPSDVTWAPEPEFGFYADNGFGGLIQVISQDDNDPNTPATTYMIGSIGTELRWGTFLLGVYNPEADSTSYYIPNTMAFDNVQPGCNPTVDLSSVTAPCGGTGSNRQSGVIGVPDATYEDEIVLPNDLCTFFSRSRCFEVDFYFTNLPCSYADTGLFDNDFTPTAGSACADNIVTGHNYTSSFSFSTREGTDLSILTRDTKHNGQIGTESNLPLPIALRVFAVDTRTLSKDRFVPFPF